MLEVLRAHVRISSETICETFDYQVKLHGGTANKLLFHSMKKSPPNLQVTSICSKWIELLSKQLNQPPLQTHDLNSLLWDRFLTRIQLSDWLMDTTQSRGYELMQLFSKSCKDVVYAHFGVVSSSSSSPSFSSSSLSYLPSSNPSYSSPPSSTSSSTASPTTSTTSFPSRPSAPSTSSTIVSGYGTETRMLQTPNRPSYLTSASPSTITSTLSNTPSPHFIHPSSLSPHPSGNIPRKGVTVQLSRPALPTISEFKIPKRKHRARHPESSSDSE